MKDPRLERLIGWCEVNSGSLHLEGLERMADRLAAALAELGAGAVERIELEPEVTLDEEGRETRRKLGPMLRLRCRPEAELRVLLSGHLDTVYGPESGFQRCRWQSDGRLNGPGVADMKGGLLVMLEGLRELERAGVKEKPGWTVLIGPDEEIGSPGSRKVLAEEAGRHHLGLVLEPALPGGGVIVRRKGAGNFTVVARGRAAHTGRDFAAGRNAIRLLAEWVREFESLNGRIAGAHFNTGWIRGGGPVNVVPDLAVARVNIRVAAREQMGEIGRALEEVRAEAWQRAGGEGMALEVHGGFTREPMEPHPELGPWLEAYRRAAESFGGRLETGETGGGSDGNLLAAAGLPVLDGLGVRGGKIHSAEEFLEPESVAERSAVLGRFLIDLAGRKPGEWRGEGGG